MEKKFRGTGTAIVTPFGPGGAIDYPALEALLDMQLRGNVEMIVPLG
jgi:4-hydroxy-tetrahydrodipicolinate synthase